MQPLTYDEDDDRDLLLDEDEDDEDDAELSGGGGETIIKRGTKVAIKRYLVTAAGAGCAPIAGCGCVIIVCMAVLAMLLGAILGVFNNQQPIGGAYPPSAAGPEPLYGVTLPPYVAPTQPPTGTPLPTWPLPPTPNPGRPPDPPPPAPTDIAPADATATWTSYEDEQRRWVLQATQVAGQWQATVQAGYATQTAIVPTPTPPPPTPIGGGPYGWPVDPYCHGYDGCAADGQGRRIITQPYGCTNFPEWPCEWCQRSHPPGDPRWPGVEVPYFHRGLDMDTGEGEPYYATLDGIVKDVRVVREGDANYRHGFGTFIRLEDASHKYVVTYGHMTAVGEAFDVTSGRDLGRIWQPGDRIRHNLPNGTRVIVGFSGHSGYTSRGLPRPGGGVYDGNHLHIQIEKDDGGLDIDPVPFFDRGAGDPLPIDLPPYRPPGG